MTAIVLGLEVPKSQAVHQRQLLLVLGLQPLSKNYGAHWGQILFVWDLEKSEAWAKTSHLYRKAFGNSLGGP